MHFLLALKLLALILLHRTILVIALPTSTASKLGAPAVNSSISLNSDNFNNNVRLGIAAAQSAYPRIVLAISRCLLSRLSHKDQPFMNEPSSFINQRAIYESRIYAPHS